MIGKLGVSNHNNDYSDGVTLSNNVMNIIEREPIKDNATGVKAKDFVEDVGDIANSNKEIGRNKGFRRRIDISGQVNNGRASMYNVHIFGSTYR